MATIAKPSTAKKTPTFRNNPDYKTEFETAVDELINRKIPDRQERIKAIDALCEEYTASIGEMPDEWQLKRLADEILREELSDKHPDKMTREEYPIMSEQQLKRRQRVTYLTPDIEVGGHVTVLGRRKSWVKDDETGIFEVIKGKVYDFNVKPN